MVLLLLGVALCRIVLKKSLQYIDHREVKRTAFGLQNILKELNTGNSDNFLFVGHR